MRAFSLALLAAAALIGCTQAREAIDPPPAVVQARGGGVAAALGVFHAGVTLTEAIDARPAARCRSGVLPDGAVTVQATIRWRRKNARAGFAWTDETHRWRRDDAGHVAYASSLMFALPDGRPTERRAETRRVGDALYRGFDERFVDANRVPDLAQELDAAAFREVDGLLSLVDRTGNAWVAARPDAGLCRGRGSLGLPAPLDGRVVYGPEGRSGFFRWIADDGAELVVEFDERVEPGAVPVDAPTELWPVDADPSVANVLRWRDRGLAEGWLTPGRTFGDWTE
jgi:hypothetical protein